jgi:hypothetical protein
MPNTTVFLLDIIDSNSLHGPVRELYQDNGISNQIKSILLISRCLHVGLELLLLLSLRQTCADRLALWCAKESRTSELVSELESSSSVSVC